MDFLLNRRIALFSVVTVTLGTVAYALARVFKDVLTVLLVLVIVVLVVAVVIMWLKQRKAAEGSAEIESTIASQADRDIERSIPAQAADLQNMKADLLAAIDALKASKSGLKGGGGALATLPWYLLLGPKGAGKGSLVRTSGLNFPLKDSQGQGPRSVRGVGGTKTLEWWLSEEAVLLEMPGGLLKTSEFGDTDDWFAFLGVLKKQRPERPINGVIATVALDQVADQPGAEIEKLGRRVRDRIVEVNQHLGVTFPTYVVLTGTDRIAGFSEFFAEFDGPKRAQAWGATIPVAEALARPADELFDAEFQTLTAALSRRWITRMGSLPDGEQRSRVFAFPLQLESIRSALRQFIKTLFDTGGPGERPLFRGFYLTSAAPSGSAADRVFKSAAAAIGLSAAPAASPTPAGGGAWFVGDLFTRVIFPDRDMVTEATQVTTRRRRGRLLLAAALGIALLVLFALFAMVSCSNGDLIDHTRRAAVQVKQVSAAGAFEQKVEAQHQLMTGIARLEALRDHLPWWRHLGGYWGNDVIDPALQVYARHTLTTLVHPALRQMDADMAAAIASPQTAFVPEFYRFWAWRLLRKPDEIRAGDSRIIAGVVRQSLASDLAGVPSGRREAVGAMVEQDVDFLAAHERLPAQMMNVYVEGDVGDLKARASAWLALHWNRQGLYDDLIERQITPQTRALDLPTLIGRAEPLSSPAPVPGPYTRAGWGIVEPLLGWYRDRLGEPWVEDFADSARALAADLPDRYARNYTKAWNEFLTGIQVTSSPNRQTCAGLINDVSKSDSPLFQLLRRAAEQTRFTSDPGPGVEQIQQDFEILQSFEIARGAAEAKHAGFFGRIAGWFGGLFRKKDGKGGSFDLVSSEKQNYVRLLGVLLQKAQDLAQPSAASQAYNAIFISLSTSEASLVDQFRAAAQSLIDNHRGKAGNNASIRVLWLPLRILAAVGPVPEPPQDTGVVTTPQTPTAVPAGAVHLPPDVNAKWQQQVVQAYQSKLAGKYPMSASGPDVPLADFADFFKPGGTFWRFYDETLKPYLAEDGTPAPGAVGVVPPALSKAVRSARDIRDAFFANGADPSLHFMLRNGPPEPAHGNVAYTLAWIDFEVGGQPPIHWTMGARPWTPQVWPGPQPNAGSSVRASGNNMTFEAHETGVWGFFRMLDRGQFGGTATTPQVQIRASSGPETWILPFEFELEGQSPKHPFRKNALRFDLPPSI
jgi:type VI secretion system protein ImpL